MPICNKCGDDKAESAFQDFMLRRRPSPITCRDCHLQKMKTWVGANIDRVRAARRRSVDNLRMDVLNAYGRVCACCGVDHIVFLGIDHIAGATWDRGKRPRYETGQSLWARLRKEDYPPGYQVLCHNCNIAKYDSAYARTRR